MTKCIKDPLSVGESKSDAFCRRETEVRHELEWDTKRRTDRSVQVARSRERWGGWEEEAVEEG